MHRAKVIGLVSASVQACQLLLQALDLLVRLLDSLDFLLLELEQLSLDQVVLLLKLTIFTTERVLEVLQGLALLLILAFPEFLFAGDSLNLRLSLIDDLLLAKFKPLLKTTLALITGLLQLLNLAVHELNLLR